MKVTPTLILMLILMNSHACSTWRHVRPSEVDELVVDKPVIRVLMKDGSQFTARNYDIAADTLITYGLAPATSRQRNATIPLDSIDTVEIKQETTERPILLSVAGLSMVAFFAAIGASQNAGSP